MNKAEIQKFTGPETLTVLETMQRIDRNTHGILFLIGERGQMTGCVTDGDLRRYLLSGGRTEDSVISAANRMPVCAETFTDAKRLFNIRNHVAIPVIDGNRCIIDLYCGEENGAGTEKTILDLSVVINAGGRGTRLDPFTRVLPKPLIPVGETPIIEHILRQYQSYGCHDFHIIVNHKRELIKAYFADSADQYEITWHDEEKPLGTGGGLSLLKNRINGTFIFANCDVLLTADYAEMLKYHKKQKNRITMICARKKISIPYGVVEAKEDGSILEMKEKPSLSFLTNTGIYIVEPEMINDLEDDVPVDFPDVIDSERKQGRKVGVYAIAEEDWMDMGQIAELEKMRIRLYGE